MENSPELINRGRWGWNETKVKYFMVSEWQK